MVTFIKFGGSVITDKTRQETPDLALIARLGGEIRTALDADPSLRIVLGHGSGSFGHVYAQRYHIQRGLAAGDDWRGYALTSAAALRLNRFVIDGLLAAGVPALALQPSATLRSASGRLTDWDTTTVALALDRGLLPVVHGDVSFDGEQGCAIISTEQLLGRLAETPALRPQRIILVGERGVFSANPHEHPDAALIPLIHGDTIDAVLAGAGGSHAVDVTGGMRSKIELMWGLVQRNAELTVHLIGTDAGLLTMALLGAADGEGTRMQQHKPIQQGDHHGAA